MAGSTRTLGLRPELVRAGRASSFPEAQGREACSETAERFRGAWKAEQNRTIPFLQSAIIKRQGSGMAFVHRCEKVKGQKHTERIRELNTLKNLVRGQMTQTLVEVTAGNETVTALGTTAKETDQGSYPFFWNVRWVLPGIGRQHADLVPVSPCKHAPCLGIRAPLERGRHGPGAGGTAVTTEHSSDTLLRNANCVDCQRSGADQGHLQTALVAQVSKETYDG